MNTKSIHLWSKFQSSAQLWRFSDDLKSSELVARSGHWTWHDDIDSSKTVEVDSDFVGVLYADTDHSRYPVKWFGLSQERLEEPVSSTKWILDWGQSRSVWTRVDSLKKELIALTSPSSTVTTDADWRTKPGKVSPNGEKLVEVPYEWGHQKAVHFVVFDKDGRFMTEVKGAGDRTPQPVLAANGGWDFA
jgi:hypothetical protein